MSFIKFPFLSASPAASPSKRPGPVRLILSVQILSVTLISCAIAFTSGIFIIQLKHETEQQAFETLDRRMKIFRQMVSQEGEVRIYRDRLLAGNTVLNGNFEVPDKIMEIFGATATIFMSDSAVSTNALTEDGERALNVRLTGDPKTAIFQDNREFRGEVDVSGVSHLAAYDPIRSRDGKTIGALHVSIPKDDFFASYESRRTEVILTALLVDIIFVLLSISVIRQRKKHMDVLRRSEELYRTLFDSSTEGVLLVTDVVVACNDRACSLLGRERHQIVGRPAAGMLPEAEFDAAGEQGKLISWKYRRHDGRTIDTEMTVRQLQTEAGRAWQVMVRDITEQKQATTLLAAEKRTFEMMVQGKPLPDILSLICSAFEEVCQGALCSILVTDPEGKRLLHGAAPSLPPEYSVAVHGTRIGQSIGACGTAAFTRERVISADIESDLNWAKCKDLPLKHGLRACWSTPVMSSERQVLGTFAIYHRSPHQPEPYEMGLIDQIGRASCRERVYI